MTAYTSRIRNIVKERTALLQRHAAYELSSGHVAVAAARCCTGSSLGQHHFRDKYTTSLFAGVSNYCQCLPCTQENKTQSEAPSRVLPQLLHQFHSGSAGKGKGTARPSRAGGTERRMLWVNMKAAQACAQAYFSQSCIQRRGIRPTLIRMVTTVSVWLDMIATK